MNSKINWQQFKVLLCVQGLALILAGTGRASAAATIDIKDTNYSIPDEAYFVSPDGSDTNSGKAANSPWSLAKAMTSVPSGSTIVFRGGTYRNFDKTNISKKLTLQAYPHEKPWIKGSVLVTDWVSDGSTWRKDSWNYSFAPNMAKEYIDPLYPMAGHRDMVYIDGVSLKQVASKQEVVPGTFYVDSTNKKLYVGDNPAGKTVESTANIQSFNITKSGAGSVVRGLGFAHYADAGLQVWTSGVTLENNTFAWNGFEGVKLGNSSPDAIVRGNTFSYNGCKGISGSNVHRMLLEDNIISYNNIERFSIFWDSGGVKVIKTDKLVWRKNLVENNFSNGMWIDESSTNSTIVNNTVRHNSALGIFFEISHKAIIAGNVAYRNQVGIMVSNSSNARIYNNTLAQNSKNIVIKDTTRNNTDTTGIAAGATWIVRNTVIKNNILSNARGSVVFEVSSCSTKEPSTLLIEAADYNAYYRTLSSKPKNVILWSLGSSNCSVGYTSMPTFISGTGYEKKSLVIDNVATQPFFVDESKNDYQLKVGSPAIGRGEPLPEDIADAIGLAPSVAVDLGAFQSKATLSVHR